MLTCSLSSYVDGVPSDWSRHKGRCAQPHSVIQLKCSGCYQVLNALVVSLKKKAKHAQGHLCSDLFSHHLRLWLHRQCFITSWWRKRSLKLAPPSIKHRIQTDSVKCICPLQSGERKSSVPAEINVNMDANLPSVAWNSSAKISICGLRQHLFAVLLFQTSCSAQRIGSSLK